MTWHGKSQSNEKNVMDENFGCSVILWNLCFKRKAKVATQIVSRDCDQRFWVWGSVLTIEIICGVQVQQQLTGYIQMQYKVSV